MDAYEALNYKIKHMNEAIKILSKNIIAISERDIVLVKQYCQGTAFFLGDLKIQFEKQTAERQAKEREKNALSKKGPN